MIGSQSALDEPSQIAHGLHGGWVILDLATLGHWLSMAMVIETKSRESRPRSLASEEFYGSRDGHSVPTQLR